MKKYSINILFLVVTFCTLSAQQHIDPEYVKVTNERAAKIVSKLELSDTKKEQAVAGIIGQQYRNISKIQEARDAKIDALKKATSKTKQKDKIEKLKKKAEKSISRLHKSYLKQLSKELTNDKIDAVKDGMTYGVLPKTYAAFLDMIPSLNQEQKDYIYSNLKEAREKAIDGGSSKEKHAWFGKYKGRINNYLSAQGYDLEKEREGWYKRIEERKNAKGNK
ncbi:DUF3826 domain-containing protein [Thalassobellus sediminis]|uniref:DUF3826 domain-containing protein n=1 Tax=Thalassobellus sediminis TaxID=3367753 RepID=UPI0037B98DE8